MFSASTQKQFWTFSDENELAREREKHNLAFISKNGLHIEEDERYNYFLTPEEEGLLLTSYEFHLINFCQGFDPPIPNGVVGSAFIYFKRFYLYNSAMEYHPSNVLITCVYLACKMERFNISITRFLLNIKTDGETAEHILNSYVSLLLQKLSYNFAIHHPFRLQRSFTIEIKTESPRANLGRISIGIDEFAEKAFFTDAYLLYAPSQIALTGVLHAIREAQENLDDYDIKMISDEVDSDYLDNLIGAVPKIRSMVIKVECPDWKNVRIIEEKFDMCCSENGLEIKGINRTV